MAKPVFFTQLDYDDGTSIGRIFIPAPTGIIHEVQCGGSGCGEESIEGYFIEVKTSHMAFNDYMDSPACGLQCELLCNYWHDHDYSKEEALAAMQKLQVELLDRINSIILLRDTVVMTDACDISNYTMQVNPEKWQKLKEGWIPITVTFPACEFLKREAFRIQEAYLHTGNCD